MPRLILSRRKNVQASTVVAFEMSEMLSGTVGGFLELSQMLTGIVPMREMVMDTCLTGVVLGVASATHLSCVLDLTMTAGGLPVESFQWSAERGGGTRLDVTVIGNAQGAAVPAVTASAGGMGGTFTAAGTLPEWEYELSEGGIETTTLHASDKVLIPDPKLSQNQLPELVPWETQAELDALWRQYRAGQIARIPPLQREQARTDARRMPVDQVVQAALATVPHRLLVAPPFPGYDFRAAGDGPSYSTYGKAAIEVVNDIWGKVGIQAAWESGVLVIRPPGPTGDLELASPIGSERKEYITLDAPTIEIEGGRPSRDSDTSGRTKDPKEPKDPRDPSNSPDPDERNDSGSGGFADGVSPTPQPGEIAAKAVPLSWEAVPGASQYILERVEGIPGPYSLWSRLQITSATRWTDDTVLPLHTYSYRLCVNAVAIAGSAQNVIWQPSDVVQITTPPADADAPGPVTNLEGYYRSETSFGIKWTPPVADPLDQPAPRKAAADRYQVDVRTPSPDGIGGTVLLRQVTVFQTWVLFDGLPVGAGLEVTVTSKNGAIKGESAALNVQLVNLPPAQVGDLQLKAPTENEVWGQDVTATFSAASGATSYELRYASAPLGAAENTLRWQYRPLLEPSTVAKDGAEARNIAMQLSALDYDTRYAVQVRGINAIGSGVWSPVAYIITPSEPPQAEPDPVMAGFEENAEGSVTTSRRTDDLATETTVWKQGGRTVASRVTSSGRVAIIDKDSIADEKPRGVWLPFDTTTTKLFYEIPDWPLTRTASVTEKVLYDRTPRRGGQEAGREQEKIHLEWSPQGWLARRTTEKTKVAWVIGQENEDGEIISRTLGNQREYTLETWHPVGNGLWFYQRTGTVATLTPAYLPAKDEQGRSIEGEWSHLETVVKPLPGETTISESAPEQAILPDEKKIETPDKEPPPLPRNPDSPALSQYPLEKPWFSVPPPGVGGGDSGPTGSGPDQSKDPDVPAGPNEPPSTPAGSSDPSGRPAPDEPPGRSTKEPVRAVFAPIGTADGKAWDGSGNGATIQTTLPWVRSATGLAKYAAFLAQQGGPRYRITRRYLLPCTPPGLDQAVSVSASGSSNQFEMTVITEMR